MASTSLSSARFAVWALLVTAASCHEGHEEVEICACAAAEDVHPFTLDCASTGTAAITDAAATLNGADCQAMLVGTCAVSASDASLVADATHAEDCTGTGNVFTLTNPMASCDTKTDGVMLCHQAFFIIQAHHDYCDHETLSEAQEHLVHDFEGKCTACEIARPKEDGLAACEVPADCEESAPATAALTVLTEASCTNAADGCCRDDAEKNAYKVMQGYHVECHDEDTPGPVEAAIHTYEASCEDFGECNSAASLVAGYDPLVCPPPPPPPATPAAASAASTTSAALAVTALSTLLQIALN